MEAIKTANKLLNIFENNLKGSMTESLIQELFVESKYEVYYYGVEHLVPKFMSRVKMEEIDQQHRTNKVIRNLPDFLVIKNGKSYYVESKFRKNGVSSFTIDEEYPFPDAFIMLISPENIYTVIAKDLISGKSKFKTIDEYNPFEFSEEGIEVCKELITKYFKNTLMDN